MLSYAQPEKRYHNIRQLQNDGFVRLRSYGNPTLNYKGLVDRFVVYAKFSNGSISYDFNDEKLRNALIEFTDRANGSNPEKTIFGPNDMEMIPLKIIFSPGEELAICFEKLESVEYLLRF